MRGAACLNGDRGGLIAASAVADLVTALNATKITSIAESASPQPRAEKDRKLTLDQFMKLQGWVGNGGQAKFTIQQGLVKVNGEVDTRRRRQLAVGDRIEFEGQSAVVESID